MSPTWHDKLSLNLFILTLCVNAVTSERVDQDYMFDGRSRGSLSTLVNNLRKAGFYWTGQKPVEVSSTIKNGQEYLERKEKSLVSIEDADKKLLVEAFCIGSTALASDTWKALTELDELGIYVDNFPPGARKEWSLVKADDHSELSLIAATHLDKARAFINGRLYAPDPATGLVEAGQQELQSSWDEATLRKDGDSTPAGLTNELKLLNKNTISGSKLSQSPKRKRQASAGSKQDVSASPKSLNQQSAIKSAMKSTSKHQPDALIPADSQLAQTTICGFASAKLTYLLNEVITFHQTEKIIIFYEGNHIAYYIAQALELIDIRFLIYTGTLPERRKAAYITTFNATDKFPVMLMDLSQAAHGLHLASASRIWFVNPVWQPKIEAQAIKRAHRIGQTKPVYVETIVLKDTIEDKMLWRRKTMSDEEHLRAEKSLLDDDMMKQIIQNATFIPMATEQSKDIRPYARLNQPQRLFGRVGGGSRNPGNPDADLIFPGDERPDINPKDQPQNHTAEVSSDIAVSSLSRDQESTIQDDGESTANRPNIKKKRVSFGTIEDAANISPVLDTSSSHENSNSPAHVPPPKPRKKVVGFAMDVDSEQISRDEKSLFGGENPTPSRSVT